MRCVGMCGVVSRELWILNMKEIGWTYAIDLMRQNESFATATVLLGNILLFYNKHMRNVVDVESSRDDSGNSQVPGSAPRGLSQLSAFLSAE
jgi:hypothetical protein